jgi:hypothetical protein
MRLYVCLSAQGVRQKNFKRVQSLVQRQLFGARPTFSGVLREVQAAVAELDGVHLAWANPNHTYALQVGSKRHSSLQDQHTPSSISSGRGDDSGGSSSRIAAAVALQRTCVIGNGCSPKKACFLGGSLE